jgi:hypothetical protein
VESLNDVDLSGGDRQRILKYWGVEVLGVRKFKL